jgi:hypothetical protein
LEKADTRHWTTLPKTIRMSELALSPGLYQIALVKRSLPPESASKKILGSIQVVESGKTIFPFKILAP